MGRVGKEGQQILPKRVVPKWNTPRVGRFHAAEEGERVREEMQSLLHAHHHTSEDLEIFADRIIGEEHRLSE